MNRVEWLKTPYAKSSASATDKDFERLLLKYKIDEHQWTQCRGPNGRPSVTLRFNLSHRTYRIQIETLDVDRAQPDELMLQAKRCLYWTLKTLLEMAIVFGSFERVAFAFLETNDGVTMFDAAGPHLKMLRAADFGHIVRTHTALPDQTNK